MKIHVGRNGQTLGLFTPEEIHAGIATGRFRTDDIGWYEGLTDWAPLSSLGALQKPAPQTPPPDTIAKQARKEVSLPVRSSSESAKSASPWKKRVILWIVLALLAGVAVPLVQEVKQRAEFQTNSESTRQLIAACKLHASKNKGAYPPDLDILLKNGLVKDSAILRDPFGRDSSPVGYHYYGIGVIDSAPSDKVILISKGANEADQRIIARNDGSVEMVHMPSVPPAR